jgi:hypothetical protein
VILSTNSFAQLGGMINKAKDAIDKKKEKDKAKNPPKPGDTMTPEKSPVSNQPQKEANKTKADAEEKEEDSTADIYFSNKPFPADGSIDGAKDTFNSNEFIYGRIVFKSGTLRENMKIFSKQDAELVDKNDPPTYRDSALAIRVPFMYYKIVLSKNGNQLRDSTTDIVKLYDADLDKNYWDFDVLPSPEKAKTTWTWVFDNPFPANIYAWIGPEIFSEEGKYGVKVYIYNKTKTAWGKKETDRDKWIWFNSELTLNLRGNDISMLQANAEKAGKTFKNNSITAAFESQSVPKEWTMKSNPLIGGVTLARLNSVFLNIFGDKADLTVLKVYALPAKSNVLWSIQNNNIGIPSYRYSNQTYIGFAKNKRTNECLFVEFYLRQPYTGGGTYGAVFGNLFDEKPTFLRCDKLGVK